MNKSVVQCSTAESSRCVCRLVNSLQLVNLFSLWAEALDWAPPIQLPQKKQRLHLLFPPLREHSRVLSSISQLVHPKHLLTNPKTTFSYQLLCQINDWQWKKSCNQRRVYFRVTQSTVWHGTGRAPWQYQLSDTRVAVIPCHLCKGLTSRYLRTSGNGTTEQVKHKIDNKFKIVHCC